MKMNNAAEICKRLHYEKKLNYVSGKWFDKDDNEIKNIRTYLYSIDYIDAYVRKNIDMDNIVDQYIDRFGNLEGLWPPLPIIEEAKKLIEEDKLEPMAYPLTKKQLILMKVILLGQENKMFILWGIGGSGKSTYANIICQLYGGDVSAKNLSQLSNEFERADAIDKRLIFSDELSSDELQDSFLKQMINKQRIGINPKNRQPFDVTWQGTLFFSCNIAPRINVQDSGIERRICYYEMNEKIKNPVKGLEKRSYTHKELVNMLAHALKEDTEDWFEKHFQTETRKILMLNNSVYICSNRGKAGFECTNYNQYKALCLEYGYRPFSMVKWQEIMDLFRKWVKEDENLQTLMSKTNKDK